MVYLNDDDLHKFMKTFYPQYMDAYKSLIPGCYKADLARLLLLSKYGGITGDIDARLLKPISYFLHVDDEFVSVVDNFRNAIWCGFLATYQYHPAIWKMVEGVVYNIRQNRYGCNGLDISSVMAIGKMFTLYYNRTLNVEIPFGRYKLGEDKIYMLKMNGSKPVIIDENGVAVIKAKMDGYQHSLMYTNKTVVPYYWSLHSSFSVYKNSSLPVLPPLDVLARKYEGTVHLLNNSYWYITNGKRKHVPNRVILSRLKLDYCNIHKRSEALQLPEDPVPFTDKNKDLNEESKWLATPELHQIVKRPIPPPAADLAEVAARVQLFIAQHAGTIVTFQRFYEFMRS